MTQCGQLGYKEDLDEESMQGARPVIVGYDHKSRGVWAMVVDSKGATESSTKWLNGKINEAGHSGTKIVMKSDQEESIIALKISVAIKRQSETVMIEFRLGRCDLHAFGISMYFKFDMFNASNSRNICFEHGGGFMEEESRKRNNGGGIMEVELLRGCH